MKKLSILILAAGQGVRMKSRTPKVLHPVSGIPMINRVVDTVGVVKPQRICVIVGHQSEVVKNHIRKTDPKTEFVKQERLDGSGGALRQALSWIRRQKGDILVTCGDMPLITPESFRTLLKNHRTEKNAATVLTAAVADPFGYGRIVRGFEGEVQRIVEELDATAEERKINEINSGTYCFDARALAKMLPRLSNQNAKREYYLTDVLELLNEDGHSVGGTLCGEENEALGINSRMQLAQAAHVLRLRKLRDLMNQGVSIIDPATTHISDEVKVGSDTVIYPQTFIEGDTRIGSGCTIGPWSYIKSCKIENDATFQASFGEGGIIQRGAKVGPYSRVRPGAVLGPDVHLGNFSEVKKSRLAKGAKVNHLSYLGDAKVGKNVNIGAGTITCNYDGFQKHPTIINDHAFIGSNVNLVAPIRVGARSVVGAGSTLSRDVPPGALAVERAPVRTKQNWARNRHKRGKTK